MSLGGVNKRKMRKPRIDFNKLMKSAKFQNLVDMQHSLLYDFLQNRREESSLWSLMNESLNSTEQDPTICWPATSATVRCDGACVLRVIFRHFLPEIIRHSHLSYDEFWQGPRTNQQRHKGVGRFEYYHNGAIYYILVYFDANGVYSVLAKDSGEHNQWQMVYKRGTTNHFDRRKVSLAPIIESMQEEHTEEVVPMAQESPYQSEHSTLSQFVSVSCAFLVLLVVVLSNVFCDPSIPATLFGRGPWRFVDEIRIQP